MNQEPEEFEMGIAPYVFFWGIIFEICIGLLLKYSGCG